MQPGGLADGIYTVAVDDNGNEIHTRVSDGVEVYTRVADAINLSLPPKTSRVDKRLTRDIWCGCAFPVDHTNCDLATGDLKNQVSPDGKWVTQNYYSIRGSVVAYVCNPFHRYMGYYTDADFLGGIFNEITGACGAYISGNAQNIVGWAYADVGYMQYGDGLDFCGSAETSKEGSC